MIDGWWVVVRKGQFRPGDLCVYFLLDSFLPLSDPRFQFLSQHRRVWNGREGVRLRTFKFKGQLSQGLAMPLDRFPEIVDVLAQVDPDFVSNIDYASLLGVEKWSKPLLPTVAGEYVGPIPSFIAAYPVEFIQDLSSDQWAEQLGLEFHIAEKLDGAAMTIFCNNGDAGVCNRDGQLKESFENKLWEMVRCYGLLDCLKELGRNLALRGELIAKGLSKNRYRMVEKFRVHAVFDIDQQRYLDWKERWEVCRKLEEIFNGKTSLLRPGGVRYRWVFLESGSLGKFVSDRHFFHYFSRITDIVREADRRISDSFPLQAHLRDWGYPYHGRYFRGRHLSSWDDHVLEGWVLHRADGAFSMKVVAPSFLLRRSNR